jgi:hypothetical protein
VPDPYSPDPYLGELDYDVPLLEEVTDAGNLEVVWRIHSEAPECG